MEENTDEDFKMDNLELVGSYSVGFMIGTILAKSF